MCVSLNAGACGGCQPYLTALRQSHSLNHKEAALSIMAGHLSLLSVLGLQARDAMLSFDVGPGSGPHAYTRSLNSQNNPPSLYTKNV